MRIFTHKLRSWCEACPDNERVQVALRLLIVAPFLILAFAVAWAQDFDWQVAARALLILTLESAVLAAVLAHAAIVPAASPVRCGIRQVSDFATIAAMMCLGPAFAPLYVVCLGLAIDSGSRSSVRQLSASVYLATASFAAVVAGTDYWRANLPLALALLISLAAVPVYVAWLRHAPARAMRRSGLASNTRSGRIDGANTGLIAWGGPEPDASGSEPASRSGAESPDPLVLACRTAGSRSTRGHDPLHAPNLKTLLRTMQGSTFELAALLDSLCGMLRPVAVEKGLRFETRVGPGVPAVLRGDAARLRQILFVLVSNAFESTGRGRVTVDVSLRSVRLAQGFPLRFSVLDTGFGIPDAARESLLDTVVPAGFGSGQGLAPIDEGCTVRSLAESVGGNLSSEGIAGKGSHFWVDLELAEGVETVASHRVAATTGSNIIEFSDPFVRHRARIRPLELLIADDQPANLSLLRRILEKAGHRVRSASMADEVLVAIDNNRLDAVLVDVNISGIGAVDLIKRSRITQPRAAGMPFVVFCADADAVSDAAQIGAYAVLEKPVAVSGLLATLAGIALGSSSLPSRTPEPERIVGTDELISARVIEELRELRLGEAFLDVFIGECVRDSAKCIVELEKLAMASRWEQYRDQCHALKGVAGNMGAVRLAEVASRGMHMASWELAAHGRSLIAELSRELERAGVALKRVMTALVVETGPDMA